MAYKLQGKNKAGSMVDIPIAADCDGDGNNIIDTYVAKTDLPEIEANPDTEATEELSKLTIDGTTYAVSGEKYDLATETTDGLMSAEDKIKLNNIHTVTFVSDGSTYSIQSVFDGSSVDAPTTNPTKTNYNFKCWSLTEGGSAVSFPYTPTDDVTLYAVWNVVVTYISNGSTYTTQTAEINGSVSAPTSPTLSGCTFNGWSKTDGGSAVSFPLTVTTNTTLYALWNITVTFICNGSTYSTSTVARGSSVSAPSTDPSVTNYTFKGWSATSGGTTAVSFPVTLTTNTTYYAILEANYSSTLNNNTWAQISAASQGGIASSLWSVGDTHSVTLSGTVGTLSVSGTYYAYILGFDHNSTYEGTNTIHFGTFKTAQTDGVDVALCDSNYGSSSAGDTKYFNMNHWGSTSSSPYNTNYGGWSACDLRYDILGSTDIAPSVYGSVKTTGCTGYDASETCAINPVSGTLMAAIEEDLRAVMKPVTKYSDNVGNATTAASAISATVDYLPLLDEFEVQGARSYANSYAQNYQAQYDYFANGNSKIKYKHSATGTAVSWWLRSPIDDGVGYFCRVGADGSANVSYSYYSRGLAPLFVV